MEQSCSVKGDHDGARSSRDRADRLWEVVRLVLDREREIFGPTMVQGRDGGSAAIRKMLANCRTIKVDFAKEGRHINRVGTWLLYFLKHST